MAQVKRVGGNTSSKKAELEAELDLKEPRSKKTGRTKSYLEERHAVDQMVENADSTVFVYNVSGTEFHVPPVTNKPGDEDTAVVFQVAEILPFEKSEIDNKRFKKCLMDGKLRIVSESEIPKIQADIEKERRANSKGKGGKKAGLHESGLPLNKRAALNYIFDCEDIDELEQLAQLEDREFIQDAIEERIEELEGGEYD